MSRPLCYLDGRYLPLPDAGMPMDDLGLERGYAIFDFLRVSGDTPLFIDDHLDRFFRSAERMRLPVPLTREAVRAVVARLLSENRLPSSGIRILLTGGPSPDGYAITRPRLAVIHQEMAPAPDDLMLPGLRLRTYPFQRQLSEVKTTDYLMAIWLRPWLQEMGGDDILYHDAGGLVTECPRCNFFIVTDAGTLVTPARNMLKGVTRKQVVELAVRLGIPVEERDLALAELPVAAEAFITASTKRIIPVCRIDDTLLPTPGGMSVTRRLWDAFVRLEQESTHLAAR